MRKCNIFILIFFAASIQHCPIIEKLYTLQNGNSDLLTREEGRKLIRDSVAILGAKCRADSERAALVVTFNPLLEATPCSSGLVTGKGTTLRVCYRKLFLDRSDIQSCSLLLLASGCGENKLVELAASQRLCASALKLENYTTLFSLF